MVRKFIAAVAVCMAFAFEADPALSQPAAAHDPYIDGITNFLASRTQANAEYIFELEVKNAGKHNLACYLPTTYRTISVIDLLTLLKSNNSVWRDDITTDLVYLLVLRMLSVAENEHVALDQVGAYLRQAATGKAEDSTEAKRLTGAKQISQSVGKAISYVPAFDCSKQGKVPFAASKALAARTEQLRALDRGLRGEATFARNQLLEFSDETKPQAKLSEDFKKIEEFFSAATDINSYRNAPHGKGESYSALATQVIQDLDIRDEDDIRYQTYILFFASLADATNADQVTVVLQNYMLPPVSFAETRHGKRVAISSYVGLFGNLGESGVGTPGTKWWRYGIFAPIGLQYGYAHSMDWKILGLKTESVYVMVAPVDFGYPLSLKAQGSTVGATWGDIVNPSLIVSWGVKDYPVNFGLAYQRLNSVYNSAKPGTRSLAFVSFDMPLLILH